MKPRRPTPREMHMDEHLPPSPSPSPSPSPRKEERDGGGPPPALEAPADVISRVFSQLDCVDFLSCCLVCKQWYRDSSQLRQEWKSEYMEASALFGSGIKRDVHPPSSTCSIRGLHSWCP